MGFNDGANEAMKQRTNGPGDLRRLGMLSLSAMLLLCSGCLGPREVVGPKTFMLRPTIAVPKAEKALAATLGVREFEAPVQYDRRMVVLEPDFRLDALSNQSWAETPATTLTRCVTDAILASAHFSDVGNAFNMARPNTELTGELRAFHVNRTVKPAVAEVELRLELRDALSPKVLWSGTLCEVEPLADDQGSALAVAMNAAVGRLSAKAATALSAVEYVAEDPNAFLEKGKKP